MLENIPQLLVEGLSDSALSESDNSKPAGLDAQSNYRDAAVLLVIVLGAEPALLLTRRASHLALHPGEVAFPGGKPHKEDGDLIATALREANEEINLSANLFSYIGQLQQRLTRSDFLLTPCVGYLKTIEGLEPNIAEVESIFYVPLSELLKRERWSFNWEDYRGVERFMPHFSFQQYSVEGVTALMIVDLINQVFSVDLPSYE